MKDANVLWRLLEICLLRAGPQDLPGAPRFLVLMLCGYFLVDLLLAQLSFSFADAVGVSILDVLLLAVFIHLLLRSTAKLERFNQTLAALAGTGQILGVVALPLIHGLNLAQASGEPAAGLAMLWLAVLIWSLLVLGHILRHALAVRLMTGVGIGVLYSLLSALIVRSLFSQAG